MLTDENAVYGVAEWCVASKISLAFYFKQQRKGLGPRIARNGRRTLIIESPREYYSRIAQDADAALVAAK